MALAPTDDGAWLHWHAEGPPDGEPVLMIMGLGGSSRAWRRLLPHIRAGHRALLLDNRGTGDSDRVAGVMSLERMAEDALAVLDAAGAEKAHIIGVSMGGMISLELALNHPDRIRSLSLLCTSAGRDRSGGLPWRLLASAALRPLVGHARTWGIVVPALYGERARREMPDRLAEDLEMRGEESTPAVTAWAQMAGIARWDVRDRLAQLTSIPTLVIHGDADALVPVDSGRDIAARIPGARLVILPEVGHLLTTEAETEVAAAVLAHLDGAAAPRVRAASAAG